MKRRKATARMKNNRSKIHFWLLSCLGLALLSVMGVQFQTTSSAKEQFADMEKELNLSPAATFTVTKTADTADGTCDADCSLREAIIAANGSAGSDVINFAIPGTGPFALAVGATVGPTFGTPLPDIIESVLIDGYTQSVASPNASCGGTATLQIILNGASAGMGGNGLTLAAGSAGSTIRGLVINGFDGNGIETLSGANTITGNFIGTNAVGTASVPNLSNGISITSGTANTLGGATPQLRNIISGNAGRGVVVNGVGGASGNLIQGNYIGTNANGTAAVGNGWDGIDISQSANNTIGGDATVALGCAPGNLISGNGRDGVSIFGTSSTGNIVEGNLIGTNAAGTVDLGNFSQGVYLNGTNNSVGGTTSTTRNIISGNDGGGVNIGGGTANVVQGNYIGTNLDTTAALGNPDGIRIDNGANGNTVSLNVISGNDVGVHIAEGIGNVLRRNLIGTRVDGVTDLGNLEAGVYVHQPTSTGNVIGGTTAADGNTIRFNGDGTRIPTLFGEGGVVVFAGATGNAILGNRINDNTGLGIDLGAGVANGVTLNDTAPDADRGDGNNYQNFPVLTAVTNSGGSTFINGTLISSLSTTFRIEFFSVPTADASGNGEGLVFLGFTNVTTDTSGTATFSFVRSPAVTAGQFVTATATHSSTNDTSEFSNARSIQVVTSAGVSVSGRVSTEQGRGIRNARLVLSNTETGETVETLSRLNGYYRFDGVGAGRTYILTVSSKRFAFNPSNMMISVQDEVRDADFVGGRP